MSSRQWPPGHDPTRDTSNASYGAHVPGSHYWSRSFLQYTPATIKNRQLERFRSKLNTSSEEYGNYWARSVTPQGTPFHYNKAQTTHNNSNFQKDPDILKNDDGRAREHYPPPLQLESGRLSLPPITLGGARVEDRRAGDGYDWRRGQNVHLPDIRQVDIKLTLADASVITLRTVPNGNL